MVKSHRNAPTFIAAVALAALEPGLCAALNLPDGGGAAARPARPAAHASQPRLRVSPPPAGSSMVVEHRRYAFQDVDPWHPAARRLGEQVVRVYTSAEAFTASKTAEVNQAAGETIAALFEFEHARAASCPNSKAVSYWNDPRIHNFGNCGWRGLLHALVVPIATHAIDRFAYRGVDVRKIIHETIIPPDYDVVDFGCGVGFSCARNGRCVGVDSSRQMLRVARLRRPDVSFEHGNTEEWGDARSCDMATIMYNMHEMPQDARRRVLRNALRLARRSVLVVDIWPGFEPTPMMLSGEPYVRDYLANIDEDVAATADAANTGVRGRWRVSRQNLVHEHVTMWRLDWEEDEHAAEDGDLEFGI